MSVNRKIHGIAVAAVLCMAASGLAMGQGGSSTGNAASPGSPAATPGTSSAPGTSVTPGTSAAPVAPAESGASATGTSDVHLSRADRTFLREAARGDFAEIQAGQLAEQQARGESVKTFADRMVKDHSAVNDKLTTLAQSLSVTLPTKPSRTDVKQMDKLKGLSGAAFDRAYARNMVRDHRMDIRAFEHEAKYGTNSDVKSFAEATLPVLREHLSLAEQLPGER